VERFGYSKEKVLGCNGKNDSKNKRPYIFLQPFLCTSTVPLTILMNNSFDQKGFIILIKG